MATETLIREAHPQELEQVEALVKEAYREFRSIFPERVWNSWMDNISQTIRSSAGILLVAEEAGEILGAVKFYPDAAQSGMGTWPAGSAAIRIFAVAPRHRGRGAGVLLTREVLRRSREMGIPAIFLYTGEFMHTARHIYEKLGFRRAPEFDRQPGPIAYRLDLA